MRLRDLPEHLALRFALLLIDFLPYGFNEVVARRVADIWYLIDGRRRRIACENILRSGIAPDLKAAKRIARASFHHLPLLALESLKSGDALTAEKWRDRVTLDVPPETMKLLETKGQGVILVSGHLGNWEVAAHVLSYLKPVTGIARGMNNPLNDRLLKRRRPRDNFTLAPKHDANTGRFLSVLKGGQVLALLPDQHARSRGMVVDFFGSPASTHTSHALLHMVTGAPILFGYCVRTGRMRFKFVALEPFQYEATGKRTADVRAILTRLNGALEDAIRAWPEQYLWVHRRWRHLPPPE